MGGAVVAAATTMETSPRTGAAPLGVSRVAASVQRDCGGLGTLLLVVHLAADGLIPRP